MRSIVFGLALVVPGISLACGGNGECSHCSHAASVEEDPAACAKKAELVGGACSYTTGMMAQRVLTEGKPWTYTGRLAQVSNSLDSHVAAPFVVGPSSTYVIANAVLEALTTAGAHHGRVALEGRLLEVEGVTYFVLTDFAAQNS